MWLEAACMNWYYVHTWRVGPVLGTYRACGEDSHCCMGKNTIITNWRWKVVKYSTVDGLSQYRPQYNNHTGYAWS